MSTAGKKPHKKKKVFSKADQLLPQQLAAAEEQERAACSGQSQGTCSTQHDVIMWKADVVGGCIRNHSQYSTEVLVASRVALTCQQCAAETGEKEKGDFCSSLSCGEEVHVLASTTVRAASSHPAPLSENAELDMRENSWISLNKHQKKYNLDKEAEETQRIKFNT